ncbi:MAG TPA: SCO family protein [Steroidobacteraceae bacterium]|jgi:protein SCO1/2
MNRSGLAVELLLGLSVAVSAAGTSLRAPSDLLSAVGLEQKLGAQVPLNLSFRDSHGRSQSLQQRFADRPSLLVLGYFGCVNLCSTVRAGVAQAVERIGFMPGTQFNVILASIDPREGPQQALMAQSADERTHPQANVERWQYLTGSQQASAALADAVGFRALYDPRNGQYAHAAAIVVLTPPGRVAQYLFGVQYPAQSVRLALVQASAGHLGSVVDRLLLLCCDYDASTGRYSVLIGRILQALGILTLLALGIGLAWLRTRAQHRHEAGVRS